MNTRQELVVVMYESFYGLREKPFTLLPDPEYLYLSPKHQRALTLLEYGMMNQAGFSVICGDTGAGKTTLIRRLLTELGDDTTVGLITNTHHSFGELLNWVLVAFGLKGDGMSKAQMHQVFVEFLIKQYAKNKHTVLIVDEAQNMQADTLEELRMLSNINADKDQVLQVILAGQPALRETLRKPELMQFAQRIAVDYYLEALSEDETRGYIHHRLKVAGADKDIFTDDACRVIYKYSNGTPRLINLLCDTSLVYGFAEQTAHINEKLVHDVVREQHSNSIIPTFNTSQPHASDSQPAAQTVEPVIEHQEVVEKVSKPVERPALETAAKADKGDEVIAELAHRAVQAVTASDQASVAQHQSTSVVHSTLSNVSETTVSEIDEIVEDSSESSNVTPIKLKQAEAEEIEKFSEDTSTQDITTEELSNEKTTSVKVDVESTPVEAEVFESHHANDAADESEATAPYTTHRKQVADDVYPIVHVEENPGKGFSMMILGLAGGMFIASIIMVVVVWLLFSSKENNAVQSIQNAPINSQLGLESERRKLEALQKERDAALAVSRALERERDAALSAASAQEKIRAAELRAAEILAERDRKTEERLRKARARAREAERAEAKAVAHERALRIKAEKRAAEHEAQRLKILEEERLRLEAIATERANAKLIEAAAVEVEVEEVIEEVIETNAENPIDTKKFSANPCNSPSAKFLSTCKK